MPPLWTVLPGFVSTGEQEHDPVAFLGEVDAVAGTEEEMQFIDALTSYQSLYPIRYSNTNAVLKTSSTLQCVLGYGLYRIRRKTGPIWISRPCLLFGFWTMSLARLVLPGLCRSLSLLLGLRG